MKDTLLYIMVGLLLGHAFSSMITLRDIRDRVETLTVSCKR